MDNKQIKEIIEKGGILCRVIFEMAGNPKEHVEKTLETYLKKIKEDPDYIFLKEHQEPAEENEGIWSTFNESEILITNFQKLNILCFNLGPASIEVLLPEEKHFTDKGLTDLYNDFMSKIHEAGMEIKSLGNENSLLKVNLSRAIRNCVILAINEPRTVPEVSEKVGIDAEHLQPFIEALIKEKILVKDGEKYHKKN
ncbi:MAG: hypothetical protein ACP5N1_01145 [Candidatus Woesearchaeota archaeon]